MKNRILALLMVCSLILGTLCIAVAAGSKPDLERDCSLRISLRVGGQAVTDIKLTCIRVGYIYENEDTYCYRRVTDHALIPNIFEPTLPADMVRLADRNELTGTTAKPNSQGVVTFDNLKQGVYLIRQVDAREDGYSVLPFLVTLPFYHNGSYIYDLDSSTKVELDKEPSEPTEPSSDPTEPSSDPTEPSSDPTEPSSDPTEPSSDPTEPSSDPTEPSSDPTEPSSDPTEPSSDPTEPSSDPTEPSSDPTEPSSDPTEPSSNPTEPSSKPTEPTDPTKPTDGGGDAPQTGQLNWPIPVMAMIGLFCLFLGLILVSKRHKEEQ